MVPACWEARSSRSRMFPPATVGGWFGLVFVWGFAAAGGALTSAGLESGENPIFPSHLDFVLRGPGANEAGLGLQN